MINAIINRLGNQSNYIKVSSALVLLFASQWPAESFIYIVFLPVLAFWLLDGFFLRHERLYRALYEQVSIKADGEINYSMNTASVQAEVSSWVQVMFSRTLIIYHGSIFVAVLFFVSARLNG